MQLPKFQGSKPSASGAKKEIVQINNPALIQAPRIRNVRPYNVEAIEARGRASARKYEALGKIGKQAAQVFGKIYVDSEEAKADRLYMEYRKLQSQYITNESHTSKTQENVKDPVTGEERVVRQWESMDTRLQKLREDFMRKAEQNGYLDSNIARQRFGQSAMALDLKYDEEVARFMDAKRIDLGVAETHGALVSATTHHDVDAIVDHAVKAGYLSNEAAVKTTLQHYSRIENHALDMEYVSIVTAANDPNNYRSASMALDKHIDMLNDRLETGVYEANGVLKDSAIGKAALSDRLIKAHEMKAKIDYEVSREAVAVGMFEVQREMLGNPDIADPAKLDALLQSKPWYPDATVEDRIRLRSHAMGIQDGTIRPNHGYIAFDREISACYADPSGAICNPTSMQRKLREESVWWTPDRIEAATKRIDEVSDSLNPEGVAFMQKTQERLFGERMFADEAQQEAEQTKFNNHILRGRMGGEANRDANVANASEKLLEEHTTFNGENWDLQRMSDDLKRMAELHAEKGTKMWDEATKEEYAALERNYQSNPYYLQRLLDTHISARRMMEERKNAN